MNALPIRWFLLGSGTVVLFASGVLLGCAGNIEASSLGRANGTCWIETDEVSDRYVYRTDTLRNLVSFDRAGNESLPVTYEYSESGHLEGITELQSERGSRSFVYNDDAVVIEERAAGAVVYTYGFDEVGRVASRTSEWGRETYAYNDDNRLVEEVHYDTEDAELRRVIYTYDELGFLLSEEDHAPGYNGTTTYTYNESGLLVLAERDSTDGATAYELEYDADYNLVSQYGRGEEDTFQQYRYEGRFERFVCGVRDTHTDPWLPFGGRVYSR